MSENSEVTGAQPAGSVGQELTAGMMLRRAREASGLHVAALAVSMKVPVKKLEALEADRLSELPDAVFVRALASSVCRALKIDPAPILNKLPASGAPKFDSDDRGINMPYQSPSLFQGGTFKSFVSQPTVMLVLALLVAAVVVVFFPESKLSKGAEQDAKAPVAAVVPAAPVAEPAPAVPVAKPVPPAEPAVATPPAPVAAVTAVAAAAASAPVAASKPAVVASAVAAPAVPGIVRFKASGSAWVKVTDSKGVVQFEKTLAAGESAEAGGAVPLSIVIGNVAATSMELRGQAFALDEVAKNNVARFEVK